jgi:hypothetical protein
MFADTIWVGSAGSIQSVAAVTSTFTTTQAAYTGSAINTTNAQVPFWNNPSQDNLFDGHAANVGDVLAGLATNTNEIGTNLTGGAGVTTNDVHASFFAGAGGSDPMNAAAPTSVAGLGTETVVPTLEFSFMSQATAQQVSILFADSGLDTGTPGSATTFGTYLLTSGACGTNCQFTPTVISNTVGNNTTGTAGSAVADSSYGNTTVYGYYATVCYKFVSGVCTQSVTYTTGAGNFSNNITPDPNQNNNLLGALGWNHFAFFELANGTMVFGFEDSPWGLGTTNGVEGIGDFNDLIFAVTGNAPFASSTPEPGTIAIMGLGLATLGMIGRRRFAKK